MRMWTAYVFRNPVALPAAILLLILSAMILSQGAAFADKGAMMSNSNSFWPSSIEGWKIAEGPTDYDPNKAYTYMNGAAELFIAYNMRKLTVLRYEKSARPAIILEVYRMASSEDAYGLFSFESDDPGAGIGQGSEFGGGLLRFWKGSYFVSIYGDGAGNDVEAATLKLGQTVATAITETGNLPALLGMLPDRTPPFTKSHSWFVHSHILLNQRFFIAHKNVLNLAHDVDAVLGRYGEGTEKIHLLLIRYPSEARADSGLMSFKAAYMPDVSGKPSVRAENDKWTMVEKRGTFVAIVFDAPDEAQAVKMVKAIRGLPREGGKEERWGRKE